MALIKTTTVDKIEIIESGVLQVRSAVKIFDGETLVSQSFSRHVLAPGDNLSNQDERVIAVADAVWTPDVIAAYEAQRQETLN